ncbi:(Fe-S)-binding protein [Sedimenticola sp.]|uniref:(Fe-S)-binding protein n=1 Tax=Sedimenticola sp. TaxID=1940285 RepID=UPI003D14EA7D
MNQNEKLLKEADRCVKCGICLPHCPTYTLTREEGDSPRGRISLIQGIASGALKGEQGKQHLDRCLGCLACQSACPSAVNYSQLIDGIRLKQRKPPLQRIVRQLITHAPYRRWSRIALWLYRFSGLRPLLRLLGSHRLRRLDALLPVPPRVGNWKHLYQPAATQQGRVGLFTGCAGRLIDRSALDAAIAVLTRLGYAVVIPKNQGCCGAMHQHSGEPHKAEAMTLGNQQAFAEQNLEAIIYLASGCGAQLMQHPLAAPLFEISQFLNRCDWPDSAKLSPLDYAVSLHTPCTLRHQIKAADEPAELLRRIPGIRLTLLDQIQCCGAAGSYLQEQPDMADALANRAMQQVREQSPRILATSNSGCALQFASSIRQAGLPIRSMHPIELINESLNGGKQ